MRTFNIPQHYKSQIIGKIKDARKLSDPRKQDFSPTCLDFGSVRFWLARHFGFCFGVENAIEKAYQALDDYPGKRIFFLSEMIHNPTVNDDLRAQGIQFMSTTKGEQLIDWSEITADDVVLIPAFGTSLETKEKLDEIGVLKKDFDTTCPFVTKVWMRSAKIAEKGYAIVVHGKPEHEETRATFSHAADSAPTLVVKDMADAEQLAKIIRGEIPAEEFEKLYANRYSAGFEVADLDKIGVVNQTTMLASETQGIANFLKQTLAEKFGEADIKTHFADTRDTLCYATNDNQQATYALLEKANADLAIVVGGYNSSNTTHLVELCEQKVPTFFICSEKEITSDGSIQHFDIHAKKTKTTTDFLPKKEVVDIILTSGASCPDTLVEAVLLQILAFFETANKNIEAVIAEAVV